MFKQAKQNLSTDDDWTYACHHFGITTFYRREFDGSLSVKLEGDLVDVPLFEQICVLKEVDLHYRWAPFCSSSMTIADLDKIDTVGWFLIGMPNFGIARDGCFRAIGCDCIEEDGTIVLTAQGINDRKPKSSPPEDTFLSDDPILSTLEIPPIPKRRGSGRMTIKKFEALITITSPTSANTRIVANVDPNLAFLPQSLLEFVMKHMAGVLLAKLQGAAKKVSKNPAHNEHAKRMRAERDFYKIWLMSKFQSLCEQKGWVMPHVAAFDYSDKGSLYYHRATTFNGEMTDPTVLDDLSAISEPEIQPNRGSDSVSELSNASSFRLKNPIASYLREMEAKTQQKKSEKIAASRRMAAARLKPKEIDHNKLRRLNELKAVKTLRFNESSTMMDSASYVTATQDLNLTLPQRITFRLHSHTKTTRMFLLLLLLSIHIIILYARSILSLHQLIFSNAHGTGDAAKTVMNLVAGALVDYLLCFVALIYTFSSLELGFKAGFKIKKYYADNIAYMLAVKSAGIVGIALFKPFVKAVSRQAIAVSIYFFSSAAAAIAGGQWFHSGVPRILQFVENVVSSFGGPDWFGNFSRAASLLSTWLAVKLYRSSAVLQLPERIAGRLEQRLLTWNAYALESKHLALNDSLSWQEDAFKTGRILFTYTTFFLLSFLSLFLVIAMWSRKDTMEQVPTQISHQKVLLSTISELSDDKGISSVQTDASITSLRGDRLAERDESSTKKVHFAKRRFIGAVSFRRDKKASVSIGTRTSV